MLLAIQFIGFGNFGFIFVYFWLSLFKNYLLFSSFEFSVKFWLFTDFYAVFFKYLLLNKFK